MRIFAVLCHFWGLKKVYEVGVKAKMLIFRLYNKSWGESKREDKVSPTR